jgi:LCP family protein required for cell wall assembly
MTRRNVQATCPRCSAQSRPDDRFCSRCGALLPTAPGSNPGGPSAPERRRLGGSGWQPAAPVPQAVEPIDRAAPPPSTVRRRKGKRPRRSRIVAFLVPFTVALAVILGGVAGRTLSETTSTIDKLHQVSTPPPQISDHTAREAANSSTAGEPGSDSSETDADPGEVSDLPAVVAASDTSPGEGAEAGSEVIPLPDQPGDTNADSPRQPANAGIESDTGSSETTTSDASTNSLPTVLNPEQSSQDPQVSVTDVQSSEVGASSQTASDAAASSSSEIPVGSSATGSSASTTSTNAAPATGVGSSESLDGEALAEQQLAEGKVFDTGPAVEAMAAAQPVEEGEPQSNAESSGGFFGSLRDHGENIRDTAEGAAIASGVRDSEAEPLLIMVMGVDAREGSPIDIGVRPDALMVLRLDPVSGSCQGLAIPRDSWVELPGYGKTKINHALMLGGIPYQQLVVENYLDIEIDRYALIDFAGFEKLVDSVGGVTIDVPPDLSSPAVSAGTVTVSGQQALQHARYRGGPDGDFGRIKRQQQVMRGLIDAAEGRDLVREADRLLSSLSGHIRTDMSVEELASLAKFYQSSCSAEALDMYQIPGDVVYGPIIDPLFDLPLSYVVSDSLAVQEAVSRLLED